MIEAGEINSVATAFVAGLVTSLHCVGMCGPVACAFMPSQAAGGGMVVPTTAYHFSRVVSYGMVGALAGALGAAPLAWFQSHSVALLPWVLVAFFVFLGLGIDRRLPKPRWVSRLFFRATVKFKKLPTTMGASVIGLLTPMLPCGPLYLVFAVALATGSAIAGAEFLVAFALGTIPLLWIVQVQAGRLRHWLTPVRIMRVQRVVALVFAALLILRLMGEGSGYFVQIAGQGDDDVPLVAPACPLCPSSNQ